MLKGYKLCIGKKADKGSPFTEESRQGIESEHTSSQSRPSFCHVLASGRTERWSQSQSRTS